MVVLDDSVVDGELVRVLGLRPTHWAGGPEDEPTEPEEREIDPDGDIFSVGHGSGLVGDDPWVSRPAHVARGPEDEPVGDEPASPAEEPERP